MRAVFFVPVFIREGTVECKGIGIPKREKPFAHY